MPGTYHFRFKTALIPGSDREKNAAAVWMDCVNDDQHVGVWRNAIFAKVTRINMEEEDEDFTRRQNGHTSTASAPVPVPVSEGSQRAPMQQHGHVASQRTAPQPTSAPVRVYAPAPVPVAVAASDNLLGFDDKPPTAPVSNGSLLDVPIQTHTAPSTGEGSLLDMNGPTSYSSNVQGSSSHDDFLGMTSTPVYSAAPPAPAPIPAAPSSYGSAHNTFSKSGPFGGLEWN